VPCQWIPYLQVSSAVDGKDGSTFDEPTPGGDEQSGQSVDVDVVDVQTQAPERTNEDLNSDVVTDRCAVDQCSVPCNNIT